MISPPPSRWHCFLGAALTLALAACGPGNVGAANEEDQGDAAALSGNQSQSFTGRLTNPGTSWVTHPVTFGSAGKVNVTLDWDAHAADMNVFLLDPTGKDVAYANGTVNKPEKVSYDIPAAGHWTVAIKCKTGSANYELTVAFAGSAATGAKYPGQPAAGKLYWGAATGTFNLATRYEQPTGKSLAIHRTYYQWAQRTTSLVNTAKADLAADRLPWVSTKTPSWADMAAGKYDGEIDEMLKALGALNGPVWLTIHHEPEGGGGHNAPDDPAGPAGHVAMNKRVRERLTALGIKNVALAPILMSYTWTKASGRNPDAWWASGIYDFVGVDTYSQKAGVGLTDSTWAEIRQWAAARNADVAVGEWGLEGTDTVAGNLVKAWYNAAANSDHDRGGARVVALSAFDTDVNAAADGQGWSLKGDQLSAFLELLKDPRTARVR